MKPPGLLPAPIQAIRLPITIMVKRAVPRKEKTPGIAWYQASWYATGVEDLQCPLEG